MQSRILARRVDGLDERDLVLHLALGLVAASRRLDAALAKHGRRAAEDSGAGAGAGEEAALSFVLGLISFRQRAMAALTAARHPARRQAGDEDGDGPARPAPRGDLRGILR